MKLLKTIGRDSVLIALSVIFTACETGTPLDTVIYPSHWESIPNNGEAMMMCLALQDMGYMFDTFAVDVNGIEVTYPDGTTARFPQSRSVTPLTLITIGRDYNTGDLVEGERERLQNEALTFCQDYRNKAQELGIELSLHAVFFWDYISGTRIGYSFSETECVIVPGPWSLSFGSYMRDYELDPSAICPSGKVVS
jgi:hypothetical protein